MSGLLGSTALIIGCGYVGTPLASRLVERGVRVYGTRRTEGGARQLARLGVQPMLLQVTQPLTYASLRPALEADELDVYYLVPPGRIDQHPTPRQTVLGGIGHTLKALKQAGQLRRAVLVSSSAVYGQRDGQMVDADTPIAPTSERAALLAEGERLWLEADERHYVLRLAGIYGPSRVIGLRAVTDGAPLLGDPHALLNLIHVDDAAELLIRLMQAERPGRVELGCDGHPVQRLTYYTSLAEQVGLQPPQVLDDDAAAERFGLNPERLRRASSKPLDNIVTCQRTGWQPAYTNYKVGLAAVLAEHARRRASGGAG